MYRATQESWSNSRILCVDVSVDVSIDDKCSINEASIVGIYDISIDEASAEEARVF